MEIQEIANRLAVLISESDRIEQQISDLKERMLQQMMQEGENTYELNEFKFIRIPERQGNRVDYREFYEAACQHDGITEAILTEITSECVVDRRVGEYLSIRRPRNRG